MSDAPRASSNFIWPPTIYLIAAALALMLSWLAPLPLLADAPAALRWSVRAAGAAMFLAGLGLALAAKGYFDRAGTPVKPTEPTTTLVTAGVYGYTRNPMYLSMTVALIGLSLIALSAWFLLVAPFAVFAVFKLAIEREERYLGEKFGAAYADYRARVRRWL